MQHNARSKDGNPKTWHLKKRGKRKREKTT